jgi:class 3 adenylate cyclase
MSRSLKAQLSAVQRAVNKYTDWDFTDEIPVERRDESGALAFALNRLAKFYGQIATLSNKTYAGLLRTGDIPPINVTKKVSVLFGTICSFSSFTQGLKPREKQELLNTFFQKIELCASLTGGHFDKIIGGNAVFHWGILGEGGEQANALNAVRAVLMMRAYLGDWNKKRIIRGLPLVPFSFGIDAGIASLSSFRIGRNVEYSVTGPAVDNAYHCETQTKTTKTETLITKNMYNLVAKSIVAAEVKPRPHKGHHPHPKTPKSLFALINSRDKALTSRLHKDLARIADIDLSVAMALTGPYGPNTLSELRTALHITAG